MLVIRLQLLLHTSSSSGPNPSRLPGAQCQPASALVTGQCVMHNHGLQQGTRSSWHMHHEQQQGLLKAVPVSPHLQRHDLLVALVEPRREGDHDVPLLEQQLLVSVHLHTPSAAPAAASNAVGPRLH